MVNTIVTPSYISPGGGYCIIGEIIARAVTSSIVDAIKKSADEYFGV